MLLPIDLVQETTNGSGQYKTINNVSIFPANSGVGMGPPANQGTPKGILITLASNLTTTAAGSMTASIGGPSGYFTGTLTETAANSGVFQDSANTVTVTLPVGTTTSSTATSTLSAIVNSSSLGFSNITVSLVESGINTLMFYSPITSAEIILSNAYNPSVINTIHLNLQVQYEDFVGNTTSISPISLGLSETSAGSGVFVDSASGLTVTITNFSGSGTGSINNMLASFSGGVIGSNPVATTLTETSATSRDYTSLVTTGDSAYQGTNVTPDNPATTGDGIFYLRVKGMTGSMTVSVQTDMGSAQTVTLSPDPNNPGTLISGKMLVVPQNTDANTSTFSNVTTLLTAGGLTTAASSGTPAPPQLKFFNLNINGTGSTISIPALAAYQIIGGMYLGMGYSQNDMATVKAQSPSAYPSFASHLDTIRQTIDPTFNLKNCELEDYAALQSDVLAALPYFRVLYLDCHGATWPPGTNIQKTIPFQAIATVGGNIAASDVAGKIPAHVSGGSYQYELVFINACSSEDYGTAPVYISDNNTTYTSQANAMFQAFNTQAYVGWNQVVDIIKTGVAGPLFYQNFTAHPDQSLSDTIGFVNDPANGVNSASPGDQAVLQPLGDSTLTANEIAKNKGN